MINRPSYFNNSSVTHFRLFFQIYMGKLGIVFCVERNWKNLSIDYRLVILEIVFLIIAGVAERLLLRIFRPTRKPRQRHLWWGWTLTLWVMIVINLGYYWPAYPLALWMILALLLIFIQVVHNHEFIYRRYWPVFWRYSAYYALLVYVGGLVAVNWLPLI